MTDASFSDLTAGWLVAQAANDRLLALPYQRRY
jgi:hypothetical protein